MIKKIKIQKENEHTVLHHNLPPNPHAQCLVSPSQIYCGQNGTLNIQSDTAALTKLSLRSTSWAGEMAQW